MKTATKVILIVVLASSCFTLRAVQPSALTGFYTQVAAGDPDFDGGAYAGGILPTGMVQGQLGPHGLPVLSLNGIAALGTSDLNPVTHELLWWSPGQADPYVSNDLNPVQVDTLPINYGYPNPWYPTGQGSDSSYFRTVHWQGTFGLATAGSVSFSLQVDDDVWLFVDGNLVNEDHYGYSSDTTTGFSAGPHSVDVFFDDRFREFDQILVNSSVPLSPVPEPSIAALLAIGAVGFFVRRRR
jgi:hypothetical protein